MASSASSASSSGGAAAGARGKSSGRPLTSVLDRLSTDGGAFGFSRGGGSGRFRRLSDALGIGGADSQHSQARAGAWWLHTLARVVVVAWSAAVVLDVVALSGGLAGVFVWHPISMVAGLVLMVFGVLFYYGEAKTEGDLALQRRRHRACVLGAAGCWAFGGLVIVFHKMRNGKDLTPASLHSWLGVMSLLVAAVQTVMGQSKWKALPIKRWPVHGVMGWSLLAGALAAATAGAWQVIESTVWGILYVLVATCLAWLLWRARAIGRPLAGKARYAGVPSDADDVDDVGPGAGNGATIGINMGSAGAGGGGIGSGSIGPGV